MTNKQPVWGDENGVVTSYMCKIDFDHELGNAACTNLYPSVDALKKSHPPVEECGIVKVLVHVDDNPEAGLDLRQRRGWMEHIEFYCELGGAKIGNGVYASEQLVRENRPYAKTYGVVQVRVTFMEVVQEPTEELAGKSHLKKKEKPMGINSHLMASYLARATADMIKEWQRTFNNPSLEAPEECQPDYLLELCSGVEREGEKEECCVTKLHRLISYVHGVMVALNICSVDRIRGMVREAKKHYAEEDDVDLKDHQDEDSPFFLDIGGEGG